MYLPEISNKMYNLNGLFMKRDNRNTKMQ